MHELSIALSIIDMASEEAAARGVHVKAIHLRIGRLSSVVSDALQFAFEVAVADTALAGSRLVIEDAPVVAWCSACREQRTIAALPALCCPVCAAPTPDIVSGRELEVTALEIAS